VSALIRVFFGGHSFRRLNVAGNPASQSKEISETRFLLLIGRKAIVLISLLVAILFL
jgi:hypothetical protein